VNSGSPTAYTGGWRLDVPGGPEVHRTARCSTTWRAAPCPTSRRPNWWRRCRRRGGAR